MFFLVDIYHLGHQWKRIWHEDQNPPRKLDRFPNDWNDPDRKMPPD